MSKYLEEYWTLDKLWQQAAMQGDEKKCHEIDLKQKTLYPLFEQSDWEELFLYADTNEAKIGIKTLMQRYIKNNQGVK